MKTRFIKVLRDIASDYSKNFMLVLAIAIGLFGIGTILGGYSVVKREMTSNYMSTQPASATIEVEGGLRKSLIDSVRLLPGIQEAERHATVLARMQVGDKWYPLLLFIVDDFTDMRTNKVHPQSGAKEPPTGTMLVERTALQMMKAKEGESIVVKTPHGTSQTIQLTGVVHDPGLAPAWQEQAGYGYITLSTLHLLGETQHFDQLRILVKENQSSRAHIKAKAEEVTSWLRSKNYEVHEIQIPTPQKHPHQSQMDAVMTIFVIFSFLILLLGSILVATSMSTLMMKQVRQIGVMKTIGATSLQVSSLYLVMVILLCIVALVISIPLSQIAASLFYNQIAVLLNLQINNSTIPYWVPLLQIATGIIIPLLAVAFPVIRGSRISIRQALDNFGITTSSKQSRQTAGKFQPAALLGETFLLSMRNVFRQRTRLIMTLGLLAAGGAMFMTAMNVSEAWDDNQKRIYKQRLYDLEIKLNTSQQPDSLLHLIQSINGVRTVEAWNATPTSYFTKSSGTSITHTYPDKGHGSFTLLALPVASPLLQPTITEGKWLHDEAAKHVILNQMARASRPTLHIGDSVSLSINEKESRWKIVGFTEDVGSPSMAYVSATSYAAYTGISGKANTLRIAFTDRTKKFASAKTQEIEKMLERENTSIKSSTPIWVLHNAIAAHMKVLVNSLMAMAILMVIVGTLALMSTMSMNVLERTREIGVMRAIGATPAKIRNLILWEGLAIGAFSILFAVLVSLLLSTLLGRFIGNMAFRTPLELTISSLASALWLVIIVVGSCIATLVPARRANNVTTREALAYE